MPSFSASELVEAWLITAGLTVVYFREIAGYGRPSLRSNENSSRGVHRETMCRRWKAADIHQRVKTAIMGSVLRSVHKGGAVERIMNAGETLQRNSSFVILKLLRKV